MCTNRRLVCNYFVHFILLTLLAKCSSVISGSQWFPLELYFVIIISIFILLLPLESPRADNCY